MEKIMNIMLGDRMKDEPFSFRGVEYNALFYLQILSSNDNRYGYNAAKDSYEDLMGAGILDPSKVRGPQISESNTLKIIIFSCCSVNPRIQYLSSCT